MGKNLLVSSCDTNRHIRVRGFFLRFSASGTSSTACAFTVFAPVRVQCRIIRIPEGPVPYGFCRFFGITPALAVSTNMIADLRQHASVDVLQGQTAVANHFAGSFQANCPQPESILPVTAHISFYPRPDTRFIEGIRIMPHNMGICQYPIQCFIVIHVHFPQKQSFCFKNIISSLSALLRHCTVFRNNHRW